MEYPNEECKPWSSTPLLIHHWNVKILCMYEAVSNFENFMIPAFPLHSAMQMIWLFIIIMVAVLWWIKLSPKSLFLSLSMVKRVWEPPTLLNRQGRLPQYYTDSLTHTWSQNNIYLYFIPDKGVVSHHYKREPLSAHSWRPNAHWLACLAPPLLLPEYKYMGIRHARPVISQPQLSLQQVSREPKSCSARYRQHCPH
jgi:hypothetical protein